MDKQEFLKQMVAFGEELLAQERKPKINVKARDSLGKLYAHLAEAVNAASDLSVLFEFEKDKRKLKAEKAVGLIMKIQDLMNPMAEDEDIQIV